MDAHWGSKEVEGSVTNARDGVLLILSLGLWGLPPDVLIASGTHFGTLAFMPDYVNQASVVARSV